MNSESGEQTPDAAAAKTADEVEQFIVFEVDSEEYAVPIGDVREVVEVPSITPVPDSPAFILGIMNLRGKVVPVLDLEQRLGLARHAETAGHHILVSDYQHMLMGVQVDQVKEVLRTKRKFIQPSPSLVNAAIAPEFLSGIIVLAEHSASDTVNKDDEPTATEPAIETMSAMPQKESRVILLLNLKKIITLEELQSLTDPSSQAGDSSDEDAEENEHTRGADA